MNIPIPVLIFVCGAITGLLTHIYFGMKKSIDKLTEAVNKLYAYIQVSEEKINTHERRLNKLDEIIKEYQAALEFVRENKNDLKKILP